MSYQRVLPRDLFNDANLLKCIGQVCLLILNGQLDLEVKHRHDTKDFEIRQDESDGSTRVQNISFNLRSQWTVRFFRPLNARNPWPLYARVGNDDEEISVFDDHGSLQPEFLARVQFWHDQPLPI